MNSVIIAGYVSLICIVSSQHRYNGEHVYYYSICTQIVFDQQFFKSNSLYDQSYI